MGLASDAFAAKGDRLYVLVDEYDRFGNKLLVERRDLYDAIVRGQSGVRGSSPIRSFLETLKSLSGALFYHWHHAARARRFFGLQCCQGYHA